MDRDFNKIDKENIWHPYSSLNSARENIFIESAQGVFLNTKDGRQIIDAVASWWVNLHGHSHPYIAQKIYEQALKLEHVIFAGFTHEPALTLASRLLEILPSQRRILFSDNGSTAVEVAIKMAIQYWQNLGMAKKKVIAIEGSFHGDTFGAMAVSERGLFTDPFKDFLFDVQFIPFPTKETEIETIQKFRELSDEKDVACFIYEPLVQGAAGMRTYSPEVLKMLMEIAEENELLCIADEVFTGFGRTGKLFASDYIRNKPDIMCFSKGLTGGTMPMGITSCNKKVETAFIETNSQNAKTFYHGHSFTANPLACAVANASLDLLLDEDCLKKINSIEESHKEFINRISAHPKIKRVDHIGVILSIEFNTDNETGYLNSLRDFLTEFFISRNILLRPLGNVIYIVPPYIIEEKELEIVYNAIVEFLKEL